MEVYQTNFWHNLWATFFEMHLLNANHKNCCLTYFDIMNEFKQCKISTAQVKCHFNYLFYPFHRKLVLEESKNTLNKWYLFFTVFSV